MAKRYRFTRKDFGELVFYPLHYDTLFDIQPERVRVTARQTYVYQGEQPTELISLNAHDLQIHSVELYTQHAPLGRLTQSGPRPDFVAHVASLKAPIPLHFTYREYDRYLDIHLSKPIQKGEEIVLRTISSCFPNDHELEGIYYDYTPSGAPQTMISQCQQYGFQRIMPCVDQMTSKLFYTTTLIADVRYTNFISTGDLAPGYFDPETNQARYKTIPEALGSEAGQLLPDLAESEYPSRKVLKFQQHHTNMAPYLFFIGVGTYEVFHRQLEYPNGKQFELQLVCLPGEPLENATVALQSLHDSIQWVCVSCGPEAYDHQEEQQRIYELIAQRESIKEQLYGPLVTQSGVQTKQETSSTPNREALEESLAKIRAELAQLISLWSETGYQYTGTVYREIAMENSLFGGMENVGNTTILASRLTPCEWMSDQMYQYMEKVKVHEFYHNINGSQVTGASPFELWLNEAVTVFIERARSAVLYGGDYSRLAIVQYAFLPMRGPLAQDRTAVSMAIEPAGFNTTQELISSVTYSKAPEFVRMVELVISPRNFNRALENYHQKYAYSNATTQQWIAEMAAFSPPTVDLLQMAKGWLTRAGYPSVRVSNRVFDPEAQTISFEFSQTGYEEFEEAERYPWIIPVDWALVKNGQVTHEGLFILSSAKDTLKVTNVLEEPDYLSASRFWSFFGDISYDETAVPVSKRIIQARTDPDIVNRYFAVSAIITEQKAKVVANLVARDAGASFEPLRVSEDFVEMYERIFTDKTVSPGCRATLLSINDSLYGYPELNVHYKEMYLARVALLQAIFAKLHRVVYDSFLELVQICKNDSRPVTEGIQDRAFLILCYSILNAGLASDWLLADQVEIDPVVKNLDLAGVLRGFVHSPFMSLKQFAFKALMELKTLDENTRDQIREEIKAKWLTHLTGTEQYITFLSAVDSNRVLEYIRKLIDSKESPFCNLALAGHSRGITSGWCGNRKLALLTDEGLDFSVELFITVGKVNQRMSYPFFDLFSDLPRVDPQTKAKWISTLTRMRDGIDPVAQEGLFNQLSILLGNQ